MTKNNNPPDDNIVHLRPSADEMEAAMDFESYGEDEANEQKPPVGLMGWYKPGEKLFGEWPGAWKKRGDAGPPHDPVVPLGFDDDNFIFLNARCGISTVGTRDALNKGRLKKLYGAFIPYLWWAYPRIQTKKVEEEDDNGKPIKREVSFYTANFEADEAEDVLVAGIHRAGPFSIHDKVRGRGAWRDDQDRLILHLGDEILIDGERYEDGPGVIDGLVYPTRPITLKPAQHFEPAGDGYGSGSELLTLLQGWSWARPDVDPYLVLGHICSGMIGGALEVRPIMIVPGDKGVGKTTLQDLIWRVQGDLVHRSEATTPAAIYQEVGQDSIPVALDESENDKDGKATKLIEIARIAYSGGSLDRGSSEGKAMRRVLRSSYMLSMINIPALDTQDRSRIVMPVLKPLKNKKAGKFMPDNEVMEHWGRALFRRLIEWWKGYRLLALIENFQNALIEKGGHDKRSASTFGTLAALAHAALNDPVTEIGEVAELQAEQAVLDDWATRLMAKNLKELTSIEDNWRNCLNYLLAATPYPLQKSGGVSVGRWIDLVRRNFRARDDGYDIKTANRHLKVVGCSLGFERGAVKTWENVRLFVASNHNQLSSIFRDSKWQSPPGVPGSWANALQQAPDNLVSTGNGRCDNVQAGTFIRVGQLYQMDYAKHEAMGENGEE